MEVENRMVVDSEWQEHDWTKEKGYFSRYGIFVQEENLLESAMEDVQNDSFIKNEFVEKALDIIERQPELKEIFLCWYYKDYERSD